MPRKFAKKSFSKKKPLGRWGIYKRAGSQLWKDVKMLKSVINVEYKLKENATNGTFYSGSPIVALLNGVTRGTDYTNITGRSCKWVSAQVYLKTIKNATEGNCKVNYALVIDKQADELSPVIGDIWSDSDARFRNLQNRKRFVVLHQGHMTMVYGTQQKETSFYKKLNMHTIYDDTNAGTQADIRSNALYLVLYTDDSTAGDPCAYTYSTRLRFIDN